MSKPGCCRLLVTLTLVVAPLLFTLAPTKTWADLVKGNPEYQWDGEHFRVALEVWDRGSTEHLKTPVTSGIPLPFGLLQDPAQLRLEDEAGNEVPCQITVLSRYWARDNSLKWVLLDFQASLKPDQKRKFWLTNRPAADTQPFLSIQKNVDYWRISNGKISLDIDLKSNRLFSRLDAGETPILQSRSGDGLLIESYPAPYSQHQKGSAWNTHGWRSSKKRVATGIQQRQFISDYSEKNISLEMNGSQRAVLLIRGKFVPLDGPPLEHGFYQSQTRIHLYRDSNRVRIEHSVENSNPNQPFWVLPYSMNAWQTQLALTEPDTVLYGLADHKSQRLESRKAAFDQTTWVGQRAPLNYKKSGRYFSSPGQLLAPKQAGATENQTARYLALSGEGGSLMVSLADLWQKSPQKISLSNGQLTVEFNARLEQKENSSEASNKGGWYQLDIGERNYHDLMLAVFPGRATASSLESIAQSFQFPPRAMAPVSWYQDTGAWYQEIASEGYSLPKRSSRHWLPDLGGHRKFGKERSYNSGGHHRSLSSSWLSPLQERSGESIEREEARSRWSINHNPGLNYRLPPLHWSNQRPFANLQEQLEKWNQVAGFGAKEIYLWASTRDSEQIPEGQSYLNYYKWLPDIEHYALFRMFEWYYLTGSPWALETINGFVNWGLNFQALKLFNGVPLSLDDTQLFERDRNALRRAHYSRIYNWMLYTNLAGFHATGNPVMDYFARWQIRRALKLIRLRHGQFSNWKDKPIATLEAPPEAASNLTLPELFSPLSSKLYSSKAKTWMEAQAPLAFHEAYKTYQDERILDALWAQTDYFANHTLFFPELGLFNETVSMPHSRYGTASPPFKPIWHDRYLQALPLLYHYSGDPNLLKRYKVIAEKTKTRWIRSWFTQVLNWQRSAGISKASEKPPETINNLEIIQTSREKGVDLRWLSPADDGPSGHAKRYFVKLSNRPIVEYAANNYPDRVTSRDKAISQAEEAIKRQSEGKRKLKLRLGKGSINKESDRGPLHDPNWQLLDAFWMAEHVFGEPSPSPAGTPEHFRLTELLPHAWFGIDRKLPLSKLPPGTYYIAIKSWDEDQNLSSISNVVKFDLK
ncbi:hypothetical protein [Aestuariirhabdus sp. LZHN29]|uniref:hypothetical protein n=1 Tax=Aestuariirhabdus sp. LZHN29 TaxID=3417462 RepID=UPI003CF84C7B